MIYLIIYLVVIAINILLIKLSNKSEWTCFNEEEMKTLLLVSLVPVINLALMVLLIFNVNLSNFNYLYSKLDNSIIDKLIKWLSI